MALSERDVTEHLFAANAMTAAEKAAGYLDLRAPAAWNRLNAVLVRTIPRDIARAEAARRRIARLR